MNQSFVEMRRRHLQNAPFANATDQEHFNIPLEQWAHLCRFEREKRRSFYRIANFIAIEHINSYQPSEYIFTSKSTSKSIKVFLVRESVVNFETDAVINAANETLLGGGGVDQVIHDGAGPNLLKECAFLNGCKTGKAVITKGYDLPANYVLHTVGPRHYSDEQEDQNSLQQCYEACFKLCDKYHLKTIAAPCVGCGVYGFPLSTSAQIVKKTIQSYLNKGNPIIEIIILALFKQEEWDTYLSIFNSSS